MHTRATKCIHTSPAHTRTSISYGIHTFRPPPHAEEDTRMPQNQFPNNIHSPAPAVQDGEGGKGREGEGKEGGGKGKRGKEIEREGEGGRVQTLTHARVWVTRVRA